MGHKGAPSWWAEYEGTTPCDCGTEHRETIKEYIGYSDFGYFLRECALCGDRWRYAIEG